ncbi:MAG: 4Fe-4S dicluster domain-containing protein [Chloroflexota bacterium]|nr:MAG: 4Fe-4S dicluster domain-containing protein [Chloroflexota bacterium]
MRLFMDSARCSGCRACQVACSLNLFKESNPKKAALVVIPHFPAPGVYELKVCTQCGDCAAVCPTEAIKQNSRGAYYVDIDECNLCEACVVECPESVMFVRAELATTAWKCDLCGDCVSVCGMDALWIAEEPAMAA